MRSRGPLRGEMGKQVIPRVTLTLMASGPEAMESRALRLWSAGAPMPALDQHVFVLGPRAHLILEAMQAPLIDSCSPHSYC